MKKQANTMLLISLLFILVCYLELVANEYLNNNLKFFIYYLHSHFFTNKILLELYKKIRCSRNVPFQIFEHIKSPYIIRTY